MIYNAEHEKHVEGAHDPVAQSIRPEARKRRHRHRSTEHEPYTACEYAPEPRAGKKRKACQAARRKRLANYKKVEKLHEQGMSMLAICRTLGMSREALRRYVHADSFPERRRHPRQPAVIHPLIQCFKKTIKNTNSDGQAEKLGGWLREALASGVKDFETFAMGLKR